MAISGDGARGRQRSISIKTTSQIADLIAGGNRNQVIIHNSGKSLFKKKTKSQQQAEWDEFERNMREYQARQELRAARKAAKKTS